MTPPSQPQYPRRAGGCAALFVAFAVAASLSACGGPIDDSGSDRDDAPAAADARGDGLLYAASYESPGEIAEAFDGGRATFDPVRPVRQVSLMYDARGSTRLEWRAVRDQRRSPWQSVEVTWSEGRAHVARAILDRSADRVEFRATGPLESAYFEFSPRVTARLEGPLTRDLPAAGPERETDGDFRTTRQLEAPRSLVIPRKQWGARDPNKVCGYKHSPYRMTIHHTASPDDDGGDPAKRMRQIQAFHIDNRGWCDIGYHFVVSQSGKIYQGRSTEKRTGAHVGGENKGNIGISLIGNFEQQTVGSTQFDATTKIVDWAHTTYNIPLNRKKAKGHTEWPNQSTSCPGTNMLNRLDELLNKSDNAWSGGGNSWKVEIDTNIATSKNPYDQGSSKTISDAFPGDKLTAEIVVTNKSSQPIRDVWIGYALGTPYLKPTGYTIYDDHPKHDQKSWSVNDSNSAEENPAKLGSSGKLLLYAFSAGESKQIRIHLRANRYSLGPGDHPDVRGWVRSIKEIYGTKEKWSGKTSTNKVGEDLRDLDQIDIPSRDEWRFESDDTPQNLEGWTGCCGADYDELKVNVDDGAMAMNVSGANPRLRSPPWTRVDADTYNQLVVRVRSHDGPHPMAVYWKRKGEGFAKQRSFRFRAPGDGSFQTLSVPLGRADNWSGTVTGLRIVPLDSGEAPSGASWYDVDGLYFRSSQSGETTSEREPYANATIVDRSGGPSSSSTPDGGSGGTDLQPRNRSRAEDIRVKGCTTSEIPQPLPAGVWALVLAVGFVRRGGTYLTSSTA